MHARPAFWILTCSALGLALTASAAVSVVDLGIVEPPGCFGGYQLGAFPADLSEPRTLTTALAPPTAFAGSGNLIFDAELRHSPLGSLWETWSHGYAGSVYYLDGDELSLTLPANTLAFYLYIQPNSKLSQFEFEVGSSATSITCQISGDGGARGIGFYTDDPMDPIRSVTVLQTTGSSDGFAVGEFGINVIPEPGSFGAVAALGLLGFVGGRRRRDRRGSLGNAGPSGQ